MTITRRGFLGVLGAIAVLPKVAARTIAHPVQTYKLVVGPPFRWRVPKDLVEDMKTARVRTYRDMVARFGQLDVKDEDEGLTWP